MFGHISYINIHVYEYLCVFMYIYTHSCMTNFLLGLCNFVETRFALWIIKILIIRCEKKFMFFPLDGIKKTPRTFSHT